MTTTFTYTTVADLEVGDVFWWDALDTYNRPGIVVRTLQRSGDGRGFPVRYVINEMHVCKPELRVVVRTTV